LVRLRPARRARDQVEGVNVPVKVLPGPDMIAVSAGVSSPQVSSGGIVYSPVNVEPLTRST
jgi:hypothetical protein